MAKIKCSELYLSSQVAPMPFEGPLAPFAIANVLHAIPVGDCPSDDMQWEQRPNRVKFVSGPLKDIYYEVDGDDLIVYEGIYSHRVPRAGIFINAKPIAS